MILSLAISVAPLVAIAWTSWIIPAENPSPNLFIDQEAFCSSKLTCISAFSNACLFDIFCSSNSRLALSSASFFCSSSNSTIDLVVSVENWEASLVTSSIATCLLLTIISFDSAVLVASAILSSFIAKSSAALFSASAFNSSCVFLLVAIASALASAAVGTAVGVTSAVVFAGGAGVLVIDAIGEVQVLLISFTSALVPLVLLKSEVRLFWFNCASLEAMLFSAIFLCCYFEIYLFCSCIPSTSIRYYSVTKCYIRWCYWRHSPISYIEWSVIRYMC